MKRINEKLMKIFEKKSQRSFKKRKRSESCIGSPSLDSDILTNIQNIITAEKEKFERS